MLGEAFTIEFDIKTEFNYSGKDGATWGKKKKAWIGL